VSTYGITFRETTGTQHGEWFTWFDVSQAGEHLCAVRVRVGREAIFAAGQHLKLDDPWSSPDSEGFARGIARLVTRRVEGGLTAGTFGPTEGHDFYTIDIMAFDDEDVNLLLRNLMTGDKDCTYQEREGGDLYCSAASPNDETALPLVLSNGRRVAPTSRPLCASCGLPDTDYICSHFMHPQVFGIRASGGPSGFVGRNLHDGLCDLNRPEFARMGDCHAGGNPCWERVVSVEEGGAVAAAPPQALEQALDDFDVRWRLAFGRAILRLPGAEDVSTLAQPCSTRDEFERRLSVLADIVKRLDVPDDLLPPNGDVIGKDQTLNRLDALLRSRLGPDDAAPAATATGVLRKVNRLRVGAQHSGAQGQRAQAADALGVPLDGRWGEAWNGVRAATVQALRDLGDAARRIADAAE
jgi:hypothetical protein